MPKKPSLKRPGLALKPVHPGTCRECGFSNCPIDQCPICGGGVWTKAQAREHNFMLRARKYRDSLAKRRLTA